MRPKVRSGIQPSLYTIDVTAVVLNVGRSKIYDLIRRDILKVIKIDRCNRVAAETVHRIAREGVPEAAAEQEVQSA
jgi:hypothetical protein